MAITYIGTKTGPDILGRRRLCSVPLALDNSYPSGGYSIVSGSLKGNGAGNRVISGVTLVGGVPAAMGYLYFWDTTNKTLRVARPADFGTKTYNVSNVKGATNAAGTEGNADQNAAPTNSQLLLAETSFTALAGTMTPTTQPDIPRNVTITIRNNSGGSLNLFEGVTTFLVTGTDKNGLALTESITLTSTSGNKAVANTKYRYVQGAKAFRTITSVAITNAPAGGLLGSLGVGSRLGLPTPLFTPAVADVTSITVGAAAQTISGTVLSAGGVDTANNTVNVGTIADAAAVAITYQSNGEVAAGTDLSAVTNVHLHFYVL
jgi:hypothetical protein